MTLPSIASQWTKSSYSNGAGGECVEVAMLTEACVGVRDSKTPHKPSISVPRPAWTGFVIALLDDQLH